MGLGHVFLFMIIVGILICGVLMFNEELFWFGFVGLFALVVLTWVAWRTGAKR